MKSKPRSETAGGDKALYQPQRTGRAEELVYATLGLVGIVAIITACISGSRPAQSQAGNRVPSGQAVADVRTAAAMMRYLLADQAGTPSNLFQLGTQQNVAIPTNTAAKRKA